MKKLNIILLLLTFACSTQLYGAQNQVQSEIDFSKKAIRDGFYDLAEEKLNALLVAGIPKELGGEVHLLLGRVYYEKSLPARPSPNSISFWTSSRIPSSPRRRLTG